MTFDKYILNDGIPIPVDFQTWSIWFEKADRVIARTTIKEMIVSTVFLGLNHNFTDTGPPLLFETLVFGGKYADEMERYATLDDALAGHERMVAHVSTDDDL